MPSFEFELGETIRQGLCNTLSVAERTAQLGERFYDTVGLRPAGDLSGQAAQLWSNAAGLACNRVPQDLSGEVQSPFQGGQCDGELYLFDRQGTINGNPIGGIAPSSGVGAISLRNRANPSGGSITEVVLGDGTVLPCSSTSNPNAETGCLITNVRLADGSPDDCGNPPAEGPPYDEGDFTVPTTVNFDDENNNPQSIDVDLVYKPVNTNDRGDFVVPVEVNFNDGSSLFGDFNLTTGDISVGGGNSDGDGVTNDPTELEDGEDEVPDGLVIVGVKVSAAVNTSVSTATEIFTPEGSPNLFVPRLGTVRFRYETPEQGSVLGPDLSVKQLEEIFWSGPVASGVVLQENIGTTFVFRLIVVKESAVGLFGGGGST